MMRIGCIVLFFIQTTCQYQTVDQNDIIRLTPNILTQARFYQLRRRQPAKLSFMKTAMKTNPLRKSVIDSDIGAICSNGRIGLVSNRPIVGRLYASHKEKNSECIQFLTKDIVPSWFVTDIDGPCGVETIRLKSAVEYRLTVVLSWAYDQLTEDDKIYEVVCRYNEQNTTVEAYYDITDFHAAPIMNISALPTCQYSIHSDESLGPATFSASIGDLVYHRWSCSNNEYLFKIYRCYVHNGIDKSYMIIDEEGCSLDEDILPHPEYDTENAVATAPAKAFRFSKSKRVHFNCLLALCHRNDPSCHKSIPPQCPRNHRKRDLTSDVPIEERLLRIHDLITSSDSHSHTSSLSSSSTNENMSTGRIISISSNDIFVPPPDNNAHILENADDGLATNNDNCVGSSEKLMAWLYFLCFSNALSICCAILAFVQLARNRYTIELSKYRKSMANHFQF